jgi:hypothetical protein
LWFPLCVEGDFEMEIQGFNSQQLDVLSLIVCWFLVSERKKKSEMQNKIQIIIAITVKKFKLLVDKLI